MKTPVATPSLSERVAGAIFWNTVAFPVKAAIKFLASLVIAWALTRQEYGLFQASIGSLVATIWVCTGLGISASILKFVPEVMQYQGRTGVGRFLRQLFLLRLGFLCLVTLLLNLASGVVISYFHLGSLGLFLLRSGSAVILMRAVTDTAGRVLTAYFRQKATNALDIVSSLVQPLLILLLVPSQGFGLGIRGAVIALLFGSAIDMILALYAVSQALRRLPDEGTTVAPVAKLWQRFGASAFMNYVMDLSVYITSPDFVGPVLLVFARIGDVGDIEAGWNQVIILLTYLVLPLNGIYVPMFSEIFARRDTHKLQAAYATLTRALLLATVPAGIGWITLAPHAFVLLRLAQKFPHAATVAQVLTFFLFLESIVVIPHVILMVYEQYRVVLASRLLALLSVPLIIWSVQVGSPVTAAITIGLLRCLSRLVLTPYANRKYGLQFPWAFAFRLTLPSLVFAVVLTALSPTLPVLTTLPVWRNVVDLGLLVLIGAIIFIAGFKLLGGLDDADRQRLGTLRIPFRNVILRYF